MVNRRYLGTIFSTNNQTWKESGEETAGRPEYEEGEDTGVQHHQGQAAADCLHNSVPYLQIYATPKILAHASHPKVRKIL